jgi:hypothetical protein
MANAPQGLKIDAMPLKQQNPPANKPEQFRVGRPHNFPPRFALHPSHSQRTTRRIVRRTSDKVSSPKQ